MEHAQDFDDGRLECTVSNPRKENEGSKDAYVSYLITTKTNFKSFQVGFAPHCLWILNLLGISAQKRKSDEDLRTLSTSTIHYVPNIRLWPFRHCLRSTTCHMFVEIDSVQSSPVDECGHYTASSDASLFIQNFDDHPYSSSFSKAINGMRRCIIGHLVAHRYQEMEVEVPSSPSPIPFSTLLQRCTNQTSASLKYENERTNWMKN